MIKLFIFTILFVFPIRAIVTDDIVIDRSEAQKAYKLLNEIRAHPSKYFKQLKFDKSLKINNAPLKWNDTLAKVAEDKAYDMANRNYFDHVDPDSIGINYLIAKSGYKLNAAWYKNKSENYFESIGSNAKNGKEAIKDLIIDDPESDHGHRDHLLGVGNWNTTLYDIGIGFVRRASGSDYQTYISVVIARHDW